MNHWHRLRDRVRFAHPARAAGIPAVIALVGVLAIDCAWPAAPAATSDSDSETILAVIGDQRITQADVIALAEDVFEKQQDEYDRQLRRFRFEFDQSRHALLQEQLDRLLDRRALEMEATARDTSTDALIKDIKVAAVTDDEIRAFYDANKARTAMSFEQLAPRIEQYLASQHNTAATRGFYDALRAKYHIQSELQPYRVALAATGPSRGRADAPVTIVEFGDFQCPYCKQAESALQSVLANHPQDVRLVFRHMPLTQLHPNAMTAAEAGVCADRQGKFWAMHDAMYADQNALDAGGLRDTAKRIGLDGQRFAACMSDGATLQAIGADTSAAQDLGIGGTPYFFVNGRPLNGSMPVEKFESVIADELRRLGSHVAGAAHSAVAPHS